MGLEAVCELLSSVDAMAGFFAALPKTHTIVVSIPSVPPASEPWS